jgi:Holliday junction DNA helicase RuvB
MSDETPRVTAPESQPEDNIDQALRPKVLKELIGQNQVKQNLEILIAAARQRKEALDHVLFYGPPGLGKTTLAHVLANEMGVSIKITSGPAIERTGDLAAILTNLRANDILFIDESTAWVELWKKCFILRWKITPLISSSVKDRQPGLYALNSLALRHRRHDPAGPCHFSIGARFGAVYRLDYYDQAAMQKIVKRAAEMLKVEAHEDGIAEIARRARGTPRVALRLLRRVRDFTQVRSDGVIQHQVACDALDLLAVDDLGLDDVDRRVLSTVIEKFNGGPVGWPPLPLHQRGTRHDHGRG